MPESEGQAAKAPKLGAQWTDIATTNVRKSGPEWQQVASRPCCGFDGEVSVSSCIGINHHRECSRRPAFTGSNLYELSVLGHRKNRLLAVGVAVDRDVRGSVP